MGSNESSFQKRNFQMKIAVIGSGISGISAAHNLNNQFQISIFEKNSYIGGHSNTIQAMDSENKPISIDTGFIVFNKKNYRKFSHFLKQLNVSVIKSDMSFSHENTTEETIYSTKLRGFFPGLKSFLLFKNWKFLISILITIKKLKNSDQHRNINTPIYNTLIEMDCPEKVIDDYFMPMASAIWSSNIDHARNIPTSTFIKFFDNHGLLNIFFRPQWLTVNQGSKNYINNFIDNFEGEINLNTEIASVVSLSNEIQIKFKNGEIKKFDYAVIATHSYQATELVKNIPSDKKLILSEYPYTFNKVILHKDQSFMPKNQKLWSSWNSVISKSNNGQIQVTYFMNKLQKLHSQTNFFVTLNPHIYPNKNLTIYETDYAHPVLNHSESENLENFKRLNQNDRILYCGAYLQNGFHEDGYVSGQKVAEILNSFI